MIGLNGMSLRNGRRLIKKINHKFGKINLRKFIVFSFIGVLLLSLAAVSLQPIPVLASGGLSTTIKSIIISLVASLGLSPSSASFSNALENNAVMNRSIETIAEGTTTAADIDNALTSMGVDVTNITDILSNSADDVYNVVSNAPAGTDTSAFTGLGAATAGQNIAASAQHAAETGEVGAAIGGSAVGLFNGLGWAMPIIWGNQVRSTACERLEKLMSNGLSYNTGDEIISHLYPGGGSASIEYIQPVSGTKRQIYTYNDYAIPVYYSDSNTYRIMPMPNKGDNACIMYTATIDSQNKVTWQRTYTNTNSSLGTIDSNKSIVGKFYTFLNSNALNAAFNNGWTPDENISPDIIGENGNQKGTWNIDNNQNIFNFPDIKPTFNINNNQYISPIDWDDFKKWQSTARTNTENGDTGSETQGDDFINMLRDYINHWDGTIPQPTLSPIFNPDAVTRPDIPLTTQYDKPENDLEQRDEVINGMGTMDLRNVFPFCIPWDLLAMMQKFDVGREAPHLQFNLNLGLAGNYNIDIDFSAWDEVAMILRAMELIVFIVGLALASRKLVGS